MSKAEIRRQLRAWNARIHVCRGGSGRETIYPARWDGYRAGRDTSTSRNGDCRREVLAERAAATYGGDPDRYRGLTMAQMVEAICDYRASLQR